MIEQQTGQSAETRALVCIICPRGCQLSVSKNPDGSLTVRGNACPRGQTYAVRELTAPSRTLTTTVRIRGAALPVVPVKSQAEIPKAKLSEAMQQAALLVLTAPVKRGSVALADLAGTGIPLIVTRDMERV
ncbi:MAG: DUF1667 domain-containing protein [Oscillospiraceae bacterium]|nr:DUF1667 domain-containing protein [Oscillospiraceae bacterium]MDD4368475.1 DUF1667 domain-containing protein [Oscillospiraceae bacterium]